MGGPKGTQGSRRGLTLAPAVEHHPGGDQRDQQHGASRQRGALSWRQPLHLHQDEV